MPILYVSGDLFDNAHDAQAFAQGCNCQGSMRAGIAKTFRARYPEMYDEYRRRCKAQPRQFNLGDCWLWKADSQPWVFNLGTQEGYWRARASYEAIETALRSMRQQADAERINRIAVPRIGVGNGGLSWKKVRAIVEAVFGDWEGTLLVYEEFVAKVPENSAATALPDKGQRALPDREVSGFARGRSNRKPPPETGESEDRDVINFYRVGREYGCGRRLTAFLFR